MISSGGDTLCTPPSTTRPRGPWEQLARQWPTQTLPVSQSASTVNSVQQHRFGPRHLPTAEDLSRRVHSMQIDPTHGPRYRTASGGHHTANKPLPPLPPARTPSQVNHQRRYGVGGERQQPPVGAQGQHLRMPSAPPSLFQQNRSTPGPQSPSRQQQLPANGREYSRSHSTSPTKQAPSQAPSQTSSQTESSRLRTVSHGETLPAMPMPRAVSPLPDAHASLPKRPAPGPPSSGSNSAVASCPAEPPPYDLLFGRAQTPPIPVAATRVEVSVTPVRLAGTPITTSTPASTLPELKAGQCWGIKRDGGRCTRTVGIEGKRSTPSPTKKRNARLASEPPPTRDRGSRPSQPIVLDSEDEDDKDYTTTTPIYCHQHAKEINKSPGFHFTHSHEYISFDEYISSDLSSSTAARLRTAMAEPLSASDRESQGYIYIYEIVTSHSTAPLRLKIGRSQRPMNRIAQWRSQCASKPTVLRRLYPTADSSSSPTQTPLIVGANHVSVQGLRGSHKWEKLVHLELSERFVKLSNARCVDCGKAHREIFEINGSYSDGFSDVCRVIAKWEKFVRFCVQDEQSRR